MAEFADLWDLTGRGQQDRARYRQRIRDSLKHSLGDVVAHENVITAPDGKTMRVRIEDIHEPRFRYATPCEEAPSGAGAGDPEDDLVGRVDGRHEGAAGGEPGGGGDTKATVDLVLPLAEVADWVFRELQLPDLHPRSGPLEATHDRLTARGRQGVLLDKKRTLLQHALREKATLTQQPWRDADRVFRRWDERQEPIYQAVVVLVRDASASISDPMRFVIRTCCWWIVLWLRRNYKNVDVRFVMHDTEAQEVGEERFFREVQMGGTRVSSGLLEAQRILSHFPEERWNRYVCFFSDGDNWSSDSQALSDALWELSRSVQLLAYGQVRLGRSLVWDCLTAMAGAPSLRFGHVESRAAIRAWLLKIFGRPGLKKEA